VGLHHAAREVASALTRVRLWCEDVHGTRYISLAESQAMADIVRRGRAVLTEEGDALSPERLTQLVREFVLAPS
jgi:hypothetical protein